MANEILAKNTTGLTNLYAVIFNSYGMVGNLSSHSFEAPVNADWTSYALTLVESGTTGLYEASMPTWITVDGYYSAYMYQRLGGSPSPSDTVFAVLSSFRWNGTGIVLAPTVPQNISGMFDASIPTTPATPGSLLYVFQNLNNLFQGATTSTGAVVSV